MVFIIYGGSIVSRLILLIYLSLFDSKCIIYFFTNVSCERIFLIFDDFVR